MATIHEESDRRKARSHSPSQRQFSYNQPTTANTPAFTARKAGQYGQDVAITPFLSLDQQSASAEEDENWYKSSNEVVKENAKIMVEGIDKMWRGAYDIVKTGTISFVSSKRGVYAFRLIKELNRVLCQMHLNQSLFEELPPLETYKFQSQLISKVLELEKDNKAVGQKLKQCEAQIRKFEQQITTNKTKKSKIRIQPQFRFKIFKNQKEGRTEEPKNKILTFNKSTSTSWARCLSKVKLTDLTIQPYKQEKHLHIGSSISIIVENQIQKNLLMASKINEISLNIRVPKKNKTLNSNSLSISIDNSKKAKPLSIINNTMPDFVHNPYRDHSKKQVILHDFAIIAKAYIQLINIFWHHMKRQDMRKGKGQICDLVTKTKDFANWFNQNKDFCRSGTKTFDEEFTTQTASRVEGILSAIEILMK